MKYILLIALQISAFAFLRYDDLPDGELHKDPPLIQFKDSEWQCTAEELTYARHHFEKCYGTPVFKDCYAKAIKKHCSKKIFH